MMADNHRRPWIGALIFSGLALVGTISIMVFVPTGQVLLEAGVMMAGLVAGAVLVRFGISRRWMGSVVLVLFIAAWFALGTAGYAWFGGFLAGACAGVAWGRMAANRTRETDAPWTVNGQGFANADEARLAADTGLLSLDGRKHGRLTVNHGSARFEVAGNPRLGMLCHQNADARNEASWAVLARSAGTGGASVEVPIGDVKALMPPRLMHDFAAVEAALDDFFSNPWASSLGPEWETGSDAGATRLRTSNQAS